MAKSLQPFCGDNAAPSPIVFVVDDEPMLLDLATMILRRAGFCVRVFSDPQRALAEFAAAQPPPAVVLTDYAMGAMNGMDLINHCKRLNPAQKVVLVSGTVDESIYADAPVKPDHFLAKPYQVAKLIEITRQLAGN